MELAPSQPGYELSAADVAGAEFSPEQLGRAIQTFQQQTPQSGTMDPNTALLAALLKSQAKRNTVYLPFAFLFAAFQSQQLIGVNPNRAYLLIQNIGAADLFVLFEETDKVLHDFSAAADQPTLTGRTKRSVKVAAGGNFEPLVVPINAITLFATAAGTNGILIEG